MSEEEVEESLPKKKSKKPLLIGGVLMLLLGGGGFYATYAGLLFGTSTEAEMAYEEPIEEPTPMPEVAFIPLEPLTINLASETGGTRFLRFRAHIEVPKNYEADVTELSPRIVDVINGYLRAINIEQIEDPSALMQIRSHILRRIEIVAGPERINDLLIMEFVIT